MLFDLRGSGRRRVVKIVYITLAFLMGGGLVLFGIGGGGALPGGLVDAITEGGGGGDVGADRFRDAGGRGDREGARQPDRRRPLGRGRPRALQPRQLGRERRPEHRQLHGRRRRAAPGRRPGVGRARQARRRQVPGLARRQPHGPGLRGPRRARQGRRRRRRSSRRTATRPARTPRSRPLAYQAGQTRKGDLATQKALELTEPDMREALKGQLEGAKQPGDAPGRPGGAAASATPTPTPTPRSRPRGRYNPSPRPCSSTGRAADS